MSESSDFREKEELARLRDRMNQLLSHYYSDAQQSEPLDEIEWVPPLDVLENKDDIVVKVDMPGMTPDKIDLSILGDVLHIRGERAREVDREDENYHTIERGYGKFDRQIVLPAPVAADRIRATYKDGILCVEMPKLEKEKVEKVNVTLE